VSVVVVDNVPVPSLNEPYHWDLPVTIVMRFSFESDAVLNFWDQ
jgi:hypothetical protein